MNQIEDEARESEAESVFVLGPPRLTGGGEESLREARNRAENLICAHVRLGDAVQLASTECLIVITSVEVPPR